MGSKGSTAGFLSGFMSGFNAERDRRQNKEVQAHQEEMDVSLKTFRDVQAAAQKTAAANAAADRAADKATTEGLMQAHPELFKHFLKEETVPGDAEGPAYMGGGEAQRTSAPPTLAGARGMVDDEARSAQLQATTDLRKQQAETSKAQADVAGGRLALEREQVDLAKKQAVDSTQAIRIVLEQKFPAVYGELTAKGINFDNMTPDSAKMIAATLMNDAKDATLTRAQLEDKMSGLLKLEQDMKLRQAGIYASNLTMTEAAKVNMEATGLAISETLEDAKRVLQDRIDEKELHYKEMTGSEPAERVEDGQTQPGFMGTTNALESFYSDTPVEPIVRPTNKRSGLMSDDPSNY